MRTHLRRVAWAIAFLLFIGIGVDYGIRTLDRPVALLILAFYIIGSVVLVFKALRSRPEDRKRFFCCGELALLPDSWRRWMLDEKAPVERQ